MVTIVEAPRTAPAPASARPLRKFRPDIEGLRAVAVLLVVLAHSGLALSGGYVGVDVFFVISGFLITRQLNDEFMSQGRISMRRFYARRARRILPAASVVIVGTLLASWKWESPLWLRSITLDGMFSAFSGINWRFATQHTDYFQAGVPPSPFQHYWSLAVEEQFYLIWPALILGVGLLFGRRFGRRTSLIWALVGIIAASLTLSIATTSSSPSWAYFGAQTRVWELGLGALVAVTLSVWTRMPPALASQMTWLGLGLILISSLLYNDATVFPGSAVITPVLGSALVIMGGCPGWTRSAEIVLKRRPMQFVGKLSYSWYLWHWPVLIILPMALGFDLATWQKWAAVGGSLVAAYITFRVIEQPVRSWRGVVTRPRLSLAMGAVLILTSLGVAGWVNHRVVIPGSTGAAVALPSNKETSLSAFVQIIADAVKTKDLPSNVTPSLTAAPHDHPNTHGCFSEYASVAPLPDSACTFGDLNANRTIVMVGDSHANAWSPAVEAFATTNHWRYILYAKAACPPGIYPDYINQLTHRVYTECDQWRNVVFQRITAMKPAVVLLTSQIRTVAIDPAGMIQSIRTFAASGARVLYLRDTPFAGNIGSIPDCLAEHARDIKRCAMTRSNPNFRMDAMVQRRIETAAAKKAGATVIDPATWFCTATTCPPVIGNIVVYSDNSHVTQTYMKWLAPQVGARLNGIIG